MPKIGPKPIEMPKTNPTKPDTAPAAPSEEKAPAKPGWGPKSKPVE